MPNWLLALLLHDPLKDPLASTDFQATAPLALWMQRELEMWHSTLQLKTARAECKIAHLCLVLHSASW